MGRRYRESLPKSGISLYDKVMGSGSNRWVEGWLRGGRRTRIRMNGWSMAPALCDGDWLTVEPLCGQARVGDIVVMRWCETLVTHRVVSVGDSGAVTRGDACAAVDPLVPPSELLGRVVAVQPARGLPARARARLARWVRRLQRWATSGATLP
jgi:hypothetical protein